MPMPLSLPMPLSMPLSLPMPLSMPLSLPMPLSMSLSLSLSLSMSLPVAVGVGGVRGGAGLGAAPQGSDEGGNAGSARAQQTTARA